MAKSVFNNESGIATLSYADESDPLIKKLIIRTIERATGRPMLEKKYTEVKEMGLEPEEIWPELMKQLDLKVIFDAEQRNKIPKTGPVIFVSNHPFGVVDGVIMAWLVNSVRPDFFFMVNALLVGEEIVDRYLEPIDFAGTPEARETNERSKANTIRRLKDGESFVIFPSGAVATSKKIGKPAEDFRWRRFLSMLVHEVKATVVPLYFEGQNSPLFQLVSKFSMNLRLSLLLNEVKNKMGKEIVVKIGDPVPYEEVSHLTDRTELVNYLRDKSHSMGDQIKKPLYPRKMPKHDGDITS